MVSFSFEILFIFEQVGKFTPHGCTNKTLAYSRPVCHTASMRFVLIQKIESQIGVS